MENKDRITAVQRFFGLLSLDKREITYVYIYAIFSGLITLSIPLGVQAIIGLIAGGALSASLIILVLIVAMGTALIGILKVMQLTVTETIQRRIFARSAFDFSYRIPRFKLENLTDYYAPELINRFFDTLTLQKGIPKILVDFSSAVLQIIFGLILISFYHPFFVFFGLTLLLILVGIFRLTGPGGLATSLKESTYKYEVASWLEELARTMTTFKLAGGTPLSLNKTDGLVNKYLDSRQAHFRILLFQYGSIVAFKTVVTASLLLLGGYLVINNQINIGQFVAAEIVILLVLASAEKLILTMETIYDVLTGLEKIGKVVDMPIESEEGLRFEEIDTGAGITVRVENLHFQYPDADRPTLNNLSLSVNAGEKVCIAGYNGAGKSTLLQIISGLLSDFNGSVNYNGFPTRNLDINSLRRHIGDFCGQEDIFRGTIIENIALGHEDIKLEDIIWASENVGLDHFIQRRPDGYNSILLSEGKNIPRSIRSKIILARSIVSRPQMLAMEGLLSDLEQHDRLQIAEFLTASDKKWTFIGVSNDPLIAAHCDRIIIMKDGQIIESGPFERMQNSPHFRKVFKVSDSDIVYRNGQQGALTGK